MSATGISTSSNKPIWYFLLFWTLFNALQSYTLELHGDEAYYWVYSRFLDWGYFDHPPMVAIFIRIGDSIMHNELGLRLLTVITNSASLYLLWLILKRYAVDAKWFIAIASGLFIFHMYGFTTTPDSPLFFFTVLFYYFYQRYIDEDKWGLALILGVVAACLLYSKYHGILVIGLTLCANIKLLRRKSFWLIAVLASILFIPHVLWQFQHDFPSLKYHLVDRSEKYNIEFTATYPLGQLAMAGPFIGWFLYYSAAKVKIKDTFIRTLVVNCIGTFLFFWLNTFKGNVQMHWTLVAYVPLVMLVLIRFKQSAYPPKWFYNLTLVNLAFILFLRIALLFQFPFVMKIGQFESYFGFREWTKQVHQIVGDNYVVIRDGFQDPSKYNYYSNSLKAVSYDTRYYRKTQYDMWPIEDSMQHKKALYMSEYNEPGATTDSLVALYGRKWYIGWVDDVQTYQKAEIGILSGIRSAKPGQNVTMDLLLAADRLDLFMTVVPKLRLAPDKAFLEACFMQNGDLKLASKPLDSNIPHEGRYQFKFKVPDKPGKYELSFSIRTVPFPGSKNSQTIEFTVEEP
ncbi:ArnT family glycosyltransferase [Mucilaginibacter sp. AW1-3]